VQGTVVEFQPEAIGIGWKGCEVGQLKETSQADIKGIGVGWVALAVNGTPVDASNLMAKLDEAKAAKVPFEITFREPAWSQVGKATSAAFSWGSSKASEGLTQVKAGASFATTKTTEYASIAANKTKEYVDPYATYAAAKSKEYLDPLQEKLESKLTEEQRQSLASVKGTLKSASQSSINAPFSSTMELQLERVVRVINGFVQSPDISRIPPWVLKDCQGLAFLTVCKAGVMFCGKGGTGVVVSRRPDGTFSPPCAIMIHGMAVGFQIGAEIADFVIIIRTQGALEAFSSPASVSLGAGVGIAAGPLGRAAAANVHGSTGGMAACYSYSKSSGFFAGASLEGSIIIVRPDLNSKFYNSEEVSAKALLDGSHPKPEGNESLQALDDALAKLMELSVAPEADNENFPAADATKAA
jgi:lipid-binding SYLF domain-containing protein